MQHIFNLDYFSKVVLKEIKLSKLIFQRMTFRIIVINTKTCMQKTKMKAAEVCT